MAALAAGTARSYVTDIAPAFNGIPVKSAVQVYKGGAYAVELATERVYVPVGNDAAEVFIGFADGDILGDGAKKGVFRSQGIVEIAVVGANDWADVGKPVYATTDGDYSLTDSGSDLLIGRVWAHVSGTTVQVYFQAGAMRGADIPA